MEAGTTIIGLIVWALGITLYVLTACILLYLIIWVFLHFGSILYRKSVRRRKIREILDALHRENPTMIIKHKGKELHFKPRKGSDELKAELDSFTYQGENCVYKRSFPKKEIN